jgi:hypothetical protein
MDDLMLAFMVGQDQAFGGPLVNHLALIVCEHKAHELAQKVLADHGLTSKELETVAVSAERIWEARPRLSEALDIESVISRFQLAQLTMTSSAALGLPYPRHWRYGFSRDLMMAEALNEFEAFYRDAAALETVPLPERLSRADELVKRVQRSRNPIAVQMLPGLGRSFRSEAGALMKWSLLRAALAIARYDADQGKLPSTLEELVPRYLPRVPEDPFSGKPLRYAGGKVWSFGGDGDDDQGRPQVNPDLEDSDGDVVWTVKRK